MTCPSDELFDCAHCGARTLGAPCDCSRPVEPTHEVLKLFTPAPAQMTGQTTLGL